MANLINETLFQSIDTIVNARLEDLPYDQTYTCTIVDNSNSNVGVYKVKYQDAEFIAYSESTEYKNGQEVYVAIPLGDFTGHKRITGLVVNPYEKIKKTLPFESFIPLASITTDVDRERENIMNVNSENKYHYIYSYIFDDTNRGGATALGVKFSICVNTRNVISGKYNLTFILKGWEVTDKIDIEDKSSKTLVTKVIDEKSIIAINPYNTAGYCNQEFVVDISNFVLDSFSIDLYQTEPFVDISGNELPVNINNVIKISNLQVILGYNKEEFEENRYHIFVYPSEFPYSIYYQSFSPVKQLTAKLIFVTDDRKRAQDLTSYAQTERKFSWFKYESNTVGSSSFSQPGFNQLFSEASTISLNLPTDNSIEEVLLGIREPQSKTETTYVLKNQQYNKNSSVLNHFLGFSVTPANNDSTFNIYGQDNKLLNSRDAEIYQYLFLRYTSPSDPTRVLRVGDVITWKIPSEKTMLLPCDSREFMQEKNIILLSAPTQENPYYQYSHTIQNINELDANGGYSYSLPFKIAEIYNQNYTSNIIECVLKLDGSDDKVFEAKQELTFGFCGTQGTDFYFIIELSSPDGTVVNSIQQDDISSYGLNFYLYDYSMHLLHDYDVAKDIQVSMLYQNSNIEITVDGGNIYIHRIRQGFTEGDNYNIIQATLKYKDFELETYLPVATSVDRKYGIAGCKTIIYDITGNKATYYKSKYQLFGSNGIIDEMNGVYWELSCQSLKNYPNLSANNIIIPPSIYFMSLDPVYITCKESKDPDANILWVQPIYIGQNRYPTTMQNNEGNKALIGQNNKFLLESTLVGRMNIDGSGIFMGNLKTTEDNPVTTLGFYGFNNVEKETFQFLENGRFNLQVGENCGVIEGLTFEDIGGYAKIEQGGTSATTVFQAKKNLGVPCFENDYDTTDTDMDYKNNKILPTQLTSLVVPIDTTENTILTDSYNGKVLACTNTFTLILPNTVSIGFECEIFKKSAATIIQMIPGSNCQIYISGETEVISENCGRTATMEEGFGVVALKYIGNSEWIMSGSMDIV